MVRQLQRKAVGGTAAKILFGSDNDQSRVGEATLLELWVSARYEQRSEVFIDWVQPTTLLDNVSFPLADRLGRLAKHLCYQGLEDVEEECTHLLEKHQQLGKVEWVLQ